MRNRPRIRRPPPLLAAALLFVASNRTIQAFVQLSSPISRRGLHSVRNHRPAWQYLQYVQCSPRQYVALTKTKRPALETRLLREKQGNNEETRQANEDTDLVEDEAMLQSRRALLQGIVVGAAVTCCSGKANAGKAELDTTGELFSPKAQMLRGGSDAARGIPQRVQSAPLRPGQTIQTVYGTRFLAYLTRFLLTFDTAAHAWWVKQGFQDSWDPMATETDRATVEARFAEFAESVEVGLADYFTGPYGSYASVSAAKAGLNAAAPAKAAKATEDKGIFWNMFLKDMPKAKKPAGDVQQMNKQGILNLYALLKARYTSVAAKRQMAILFSFISSPELQPTNEIRGLLGETDNATITKVLLEKPESAPNESQFRTSSRRGGGYSIAAPPTVDIDPPPALGDVFPRPVVVPKMRPTSRILRINVVDGGKGYKNPPNVSVRQFGFSRLCQACSILDREGHVESVIVLDPGHGYGIRSKGLPKVIIAPPDELRKMSRDERKLHMHDFRQAKAVTELEYEIVGINLLDGGDGYSASELPRISISPPKEEPAWYFSQDELFGGEFAKGAVSEELTARVVEMKLGDGTLITEPVRSSRIDASLVRRLKREPLELLPTSVRPELMAGKKPVFGIASLPPIPLQVVVPSARYRAIDPIFGGIGSVPVTIGALALSASEYSRLALSGALCTVLVRTVLNPLELVKTKIQLKNDEELNQFAYQLAQKNAKDPTTSKSSSRGQRGSTKGVAAPTQIAMNGTAALAVKERETSTALVTEEEPTGPSIGTMDMIMGIVKLRGPLALFQSADITFLASIVFGSFGFGATELFRRSFSAAFFSETGGSNAGTGAELVLLAAAALACVLTSAAAAPFEVLRVRSMGLVEAKPWKHVLFDFLNDKRREKERSGKVSTPTMKLEESSEFRLTDLRPKDVLPLFSGFPPTVSRELPFAVAKFLAFDLIANAIVGFVNSQAGEGALPVQVGAGTTGLIISAVSGAFAGIAGAVVSHPADLILTLTSASSKVDDEDPKDWRQVVQDLISKKGGLANLYVGFPARASFFFMVIGLQFFLYDYVKNLFQVSSDDLSLVLDVFYAVRQGLLD